MLQDRPAFELHNVGIETTKKAIRSMGTTKAQGVDELPCSFWKRFCNELAPFVCSMINASINSGVYPTMFKEALVIPVHKGGRKDKSEPSSYRPIAILPALSKVLETIIVEQLVEHLDQHGLLPQAQHGFRRGHSTVTALVKMMMMYQCIYFRLVLYKFALSYSGHPSLGMTCINSQQQFNGKL